jgi:hypothetical protein
MSLEREVQQMINGIMKKEEWTRSHALHFFCSKFESEEPHQEVAYIDNLLKKEQKEKHNDDDDNDYNDSNIHFQKDY